MFVIYVVFSVFTMSRFFNVDINCMINDHELSYQNANSNFIEKYNKLYNDVQKVHKQKVDESNSILRKWLIFDLLFALILRCNLF